MTTTNVGGVREMWMKGIQEDFRYGYGGSGTSVMWLCQWCKINFQNMAGKNRELKNENKKFKDEKIKQLTEKNGEP